MSTHSSDDLRNAVPKIYLADRVAELLRARIAAGDFPKKLPSERDLAETLGVSRRVVHEALTRLKHDGILDRTRKGRATPVTGIAAPERPPKIGVMLTLPDDPSTVVTLEKIRELCRDFGRECVTVGKDALHLSPERTARRIIAQHDCELWIAISLPHSKYADALHDAGQRVLGVNFFAEKPYKVISNDFNAIILHAFRLMLRRGRTRVTAPLTDRRPELLEAVRALHEERGLAFIADRRLPVYRGGKEDFLRTLDRIHDAEGPPDGIIAPNSTNVSASTAQGWMMRHRLRCPEDVSLLATQEPALRHLMTPVPDACDIPIERMLAAITGAMRIFFRTGRWSCERVKIPMKYLPGESL